MNEALSNNTPAYKTVKPSIPLGLPFAPARVEAAYLSWPLLPEQFPVSFPGVKTSRDEVLVDIDRARLVARMKAYFDPHVSSEEMSKIAPRAMEDATRFSARETRRYLLKRGYKPAYLVPYYYRPFDLRWLYWEPETKLLDEKRAEYFPHVIEGNVWLSAVQHNRKEFDPPLVSSRLCSLHMIERGANLFPLLLQPEHSLLREQADGPRPNISAMASNYAKALKVEATDLFHHMLAVLYSPSYAEENASGLRGDWPRIPLPASKQLLVASAALGREVAELLDPEFVLPRIAARLKFIGSVTGSNGQLDPDSGDLELTARWGYAGQGGVTMPAKGKVTLRDMTAPERDALPKDATAILGQQTCDVWLNEKAYWRNIPTPVWEYTLGGYQVIKKWLSYREKELLDRSLTVEEARYVADVARRIAAILLLSPALDANYRATVEATHSDS